MTLEEEVTVLLYTHVRITLAHSRWVLHFAQYELAFFRALPLEICVGESGGVY